MVIVSLTADWCGMLSLQQDYPAAQQDWWVVRAVGGAVVLTVGSRVAAWLPVCRSARSPAFQDCESNTVPWSSHHHT